MVAQAPYSGIAVNWLRKRGMFLRDGLGLDHQLSDGLIFISIGPVEVQLYLKIRSWRRKENTELVQKRTRGRTLESISGSGLLP